MKVRLIMVITVLLFASVASLFSHVSLVHAVDPPITIVSHSAYIDTIDNYWVVGEVRNDGMENLKFVKITATFYDSADVVVDTDYTYSDVDILRPGDLSPFDLYSSQSASIDHYSIIVSDYSITSEEPYADLQFLSYTDYTSYDYLYIVGELQNTGDSNVQFVNIAVTFYDASSMVIGTDDTYSDLDILLPDDISPFKVIEEIDAYSYRIVIAGADVTSDVPYQGFEILSHSSYVSYDNLYVVGEIRNVGTISATFVEILATFYDTSGTVIDVENTYTDPYDLGSNQQAPFDLIVDNNPAIDSYVLQVQCNEVLPTTLITCTLSSEALTLGSPITVTGSITPSRVGVDVYVIYSLDDAEVITHIVTTNTNGEYSDTYSPTQIGDWTVKAIWYGDATYSGDSSLSQAFSVSQVLTATTLTCTLSVSTIELGDSVTISGSIVPAMAVEIFLAYRLTEWVGITFVNTDTSGHYSYTWTPSGINDFEVVAYFSETAEYDASVSTIYWLNVTKIVPSLICTSDVSTVTEGKEITVSGSIDPVLVGETITLQYQPPSGSTITRTVTTDADGEFVDTYSPSVTGSWSVTASWDGDATHSETSALRTFTVEKSGCLIATATFGSELTPQVRFLRHFRDQRVLQTFAGRQFMEIFNSFYYSWSPNVADAIRADDNIATVMKPLLYPLISVLHISEGVFTALSFSPELAIITTGFVASAFIAGVYILPWSLLITSLRKKAFSRSLVYAMGIIWLASVTAILGAELFQSSVMMMTATGGFVLTTMSLTVLTATITLPSVVTRIVNRRNRRSP